jgi:hypothetical protein
VVVAELSGSASVTALGFVKRSESDCSLPQLKLLLSCLLAKNDKFGEDGAHSDCERNGEENDKPFSHLF